MSRSVVVAPPGVLRVCPSQRVMGNRVFRTFPQLDGSLLRVNFRDRVGEARLSDAGLPHALRLLKSGVCVGGRRFIFMCYTSGQLRRTKQAWFIADDAPLSPAEVLSELGDFERLHPGRWAARIGQCFSDTRVAHSCDFDWQRIGDVHRADPEGCSQCFTDGAGTISRALLHEIAQRLHQSPTPSALQIRVGGAKGVVTVDRTLPGLALCTRPSMHKFASSARTIEVCSAASWKPGHLNRQLISVLSSRGVTDDAFIALHNAAARAIDRLLTGNSAAAASACKLLHGRSIMTEMLLAGVTSTAEPLLAGMLWHLHRSTWEKIADSGHITVPDACRLVGVPVPDVYSAKLSYGQVFLQVVPPHGEARVITGPVLVAKSPALHPGDALLLEAVDIPELRHLSNVLVFPTDGPRPHAMETSGGE